MHKFMLRLLLLGGLILVTLPQRTTAQEPPQLSPFTNDVYGLQGLAPTDWPTRDGVYMRQATPTDETLLLMQAVPLHQEDLWATLLRSYGLAAIPPAIETHPTAAFVWTLYRVDYADAALTLTIDMALADGDGRTLIVILQVYPDDYAAYHTAIFLPVLDALAPLDAAPTDRVYRAEAVTFNNGDITLAGTLTLPLADGQHPAVVLVAGSGPSERDNIAAGFFPMFRSVADELTRAGVAVLRYDEATRAASGFATADDFAAHSAATARQRFANESFATFVGYDPVTDWQHAEVPILYILGELDVQVPPAAHRDPYLNTRGAGLIVYPQANHLFQAAQTGAIEAYTSLEPAFVDGLLGDITDWILSQVTVIE